jgi:cell fate (sporulation/competence/biofilm development) regulator YlbF (YheA/YmcA/DUF963 family)
MGKVDECTTELIQAIQESEEYQQFVALREKLKSEPELRKEINHFRLHVFETQNTGQPLDMYDEQERLCKDYEEFRKNPLVSEFLQAELRVCRMMQKVTARVLNSVDLDAEEVYEGIQI